MDQSATRFRRVSIRPFDALSEATQLLAGHYWLLLGITVVGVLIGSLVPLGVLMGPMMCGIYLCYLRRLRGEAISFGMLFEGFEHFVDSLIVSLVVTAVALILIVPTYLIILVGVGLGIGLGQHGRGGEGIGLALALLLGVVFLVVLLIALLLAVCTVFAYPLIVDRRLSAVAALKTSLQAVWANFAGMLGLVLLIGLLSFLAALCCYLPAFFVMPVTFGALAIAYRRVFPADD